ncbi:FG-GAP-like repeat-containing protein [Rhodopirellula sp. P2]|uniref:FG-GAP-like repeat-containing protein n=1 Tax=Rhodopirellula sp. P2 TaxID=2127060 RepID=UPI0023682826|nr:FG-GAP-like repeat-containing protein [Rhodopirellula sp. P2]WDQ18024.1 FG-GAP-like repeat-containing protein [Rhodopirellula sp. P2]
MSKRTEPVASFSASLCVLLLLAILGCDRQDSATKVSPPQSRSAESGQPASAKTPSQTGSDTANEPAPSLLHARRLLASGNPSGALTELRSLLQSQPDQLEVIALTAQTERSLNNLDAAIALLDESAERLPQHRPTLLANAAAWLAESGDYNAAIHRHTRLLESDPSNVNSLRSIAALQNEQGNRFEANEHLRRLVPRSPMTTVELLCLLAPDQQIHDSQQSRAKPSQKALAIAREKLDDNQFQQALDVLANAPGFAADEPALLALRARILAEMGKTEEASLAFAEAPNECQRFPDHWMAIGTWHQANREWASASQAFQRAVELEPLHESALRRLSTALRGLNSDPAASRVEERAQLAKDLAELATSTVVRRGNVGRACQILSQQLTPIGLPFESLAWQFNAIAYTTPQQARVDQHLAALSQLKQTVNSADALLAQRVGLPPAMPPQTDWKSLVSSRERTRPASDTPSQHTPSDEPSIQPHFENVASQTGLNFQYRNAHPPVEKHFLLHQPLGSGLACFDFDLDGYTDIYAAQGDGNATEPGKSGNYLARHLGDSFADATASAHVDDRGYSMAVTAGDINQDGFPDLVVGNMGRNHLLINQGDGTFESVEVDKTWNQGIYTTGLAIADVSGDHLPDIVEVNYVDDERIFDSIQYDPSGTPIRLPGPMQFTAAEDRVFLSSPSGSLEGHTLRELCPTTSDAHRGMGLVVGDLDADGSNEIFVTNDQTQNQLWDRDATSHNTFHDIALLSGVANGVTGRPLASMGIAAGDFDGNHTLDFHVTNFDDELSNLYLQQTDHLYTDAVFASGLEEHSRTMLGFGTQAIDFENDGDQDLVVGNGDIEDRRPQKQHFRMPTQLLINHDQRWIPTQPDDASGYFANQHLGRSVARLDWNHDGLVDFLIGDLMDPLALLENQTKTDNDWLQLQLIGTDSERDAIGATVQVHLNDNSIQHAVVTGDGYMCRNEAVVCIGIPTNQTRPRIEVKWPSGKKQTFDPVMLNRRGLIVEGQPKIHWMNIAPP